ncbi:MAG: hypothetical protein IKK70_01650 [Clostridia bacterium]|nr:hypothetical protein [Clostridia bacterium]
MSSRTRWCHATYAMEVFATMMNDSDEMYIYPMHPITVGNDSTTYDEDNPLMITRASAQRIREIYTEDAGDTPSTSAEKAISKLQSQSIPENNKWLVILSDGAFSDRNTSTVAKLCADSVNTMFLGMEFEPPQLSGTAYAYTAKKAESGATLSALSAMCNEIFGRDDLASFGNKYVSGSADSVNFDVPMKKLIVFVQGTDIANIKLGSLSPKNNVMMQYSTKGSGDYNCVYDDSLQGQLLTFENVPAGTYDLSFSGAQSSVAVYYEPNVRLEIALTDATGNPVDPNGELYPGDYVFTYGMVDTDGNSVNSELVGSTDYNITYTHNGTEQVISDSQSGTFSLTMSANDTLDVNGSVTYLKTKARPLGYTEYYTSADLGWPSGGLTFAPPPAGYLEVKITGGESSYNLTSFDANAPVYRVEFIYEGAALSGSELDRVEASASVSSGSVGCKLEKDANGYYVTTSLTSSLLDAQVGNYEITVSGTYTNEDGLNTNKPSATTGFELVDNSGQITMELDVQQDYFLIKDLENGKPIKVKLLLNGVPLTDEQLANTKLTTSVEGLTLKYEPANGESAFKVWIDPDQKPEPGKYKITIGASTKNEIGREVYSEQETKVQVRNLPQWLRVLIPIASISLLLLLIWLYMNMKVLPKKLRMNDITFYVDGEYVDAVSKAVRFSGGGKKAGSFSIKSPEFHDPRADVGLRVRVEAVSPRYITSTRRKMKVVAQPTLSDSEGVNSFTIDGNTFDWDFVESKYVAMGAMADDPFEPFIMSGDFDISISKSPQNGPSVTFDCKVSTEK